MVPCKGYLAGHALWVIALCWLVLMKFSPTPVAGAITPPDMGSAATFAALAETVISNVAASGHESTFVGDIGAKRNVNNIALTDVTGSIYNGDNDPLDPNYIVVAQAIHDCMDARDTALAQVPQGTETPLPPGGGQLDSITLTPGVYPISNGLEIKKDAVITLTGGVNDYYIFQIDGPLTALEGVMIVNGDVSPCHIFWVTRTAASFKADVQFVGTVMAGTGVDFNPNATMLGRICSGAAISFDTNIINNPCTGNVSQPSIHLEKAAGVISKKGDTITYSFLIKNNGNVALTNIVVTDPLINPNTGNVVKDYGNTVLNPGDSLGPFTASYTVTGDEGDNITNTATVTATVVNTQTTVSDEASATVHIVHPAIHLTKSVSPTQALVGQKVTYTITVQNTGDVALENGVVTDLLLSLDPIATNLTLAPAGETGDTAVFSVTYTIQTNDPDPFENTATVHANPVGLDNDITDSDTASVDIVHPAIQLTKTVSPTHALVGQTVNYTITVKNTGDIALENGVITDPVLKPDTGHVIAVGLTLAPAGEVGDTATIIVPFTIPSGTTDPLKNTATVHANPVNLTNDITDSDTATVDILHPAIQIKKTVAPTAAPVGGQVTYTITVKNTGEVALTNIVITDPRLNPAPGNVIQDYGNTVLNPGDSLAPVTITYTIQPGDPDPLKNTATVHAIPVDSTTDITDSATASVNILLPGIQITKKVDNATPVVGQTVTYSITVMNTGELPLEKITVVDTKLGDLSGLFKDTLAPGESQTVKIPIAITNQTEDPLTNIVTVTGNPVGSTDTVSDEDTATINVLKPGLTVTKVANTEVSKAGDKVIYTITITNTGELRLSNFMVKDSLLGLLASKKSLAPGESDILLITYTVKSTDKNPLVNTVTVTAYPDIIRTKMQATASAKVCLVKPGLSVTKKADHCIAEVGENVKYTVTIKNTGDVALTNITVVDSLLGDLSGDFSDTLAPGKSETITYTRTVKCCDPNPMVNTVTVHANPQGLPNDITGSASATVKRCQCNKCCSAK